jgi:hypothetical protein
VNITEDQLNDMGSWDRNERWSDRRERSRGRDMRRDRERDRDYVPW